MTDPHIVPPFGHDPDDPPWRVITSSDATPAREGIADDEAGARRRFKHTEMDIPALVITVTQKIAGRDRAAVEREMVVFLGKVQAYYGTFELFRGEPPRGIDFPEHTYGIEMPEEKDVRPSFEGILELEKGTSLTVFEVALEEPPPKDEDPPVGVGVTIDPSINRDQVHGFKAKCTKSAWAHVRATAGRVHLRVTRNGTTVGATIDSAGGGASATVGASTRTKATCDASVKGLDGYNYYKMSLGWVRGTGGGCS